MKSIFIVLILVLNLIPKISMAEDLEEYIIPDGKNYTLNGVDGVFFTIEVDIIIGNIYTDYKKK